MTARTAVLAVAVVTLIALVIGLVQYSTSAPAPVATRLETPTFARAPTLALPLLVEPQHTPRQDFGLAAGTQLDLQQLRGSAVVVNFWASWCRPCREEARLLERAAHEWRSRGVVVLGVNQNDDAPAARRFLARYGLDYPVVREAGDATARRWRVRGFPVTFFVDRTGRAVAQAIGLLDAQTLRQGVTRAAGLHPT